MSEEWRKCKILKPGTGSHGYLSVALCTGDAPPKVVLVHRLVCEAWHGPPPFMAAQVAHWDRAKTNNSFDNLRWVTQKENCADQIRHETNPIGDRNPGAKLSASQVRTIKTMLSRGVKRNYLALIYKVCYWTIRDIDRGRNWTHIQVGE